jgi:hypothetical protein
VLLAVLIRKPGQHIGVDHDLHGTSPRSEAAVGIDRLAAVIQYAA